MNASRSEDFDERYNNESDLIENLYEFHPDYFNDLMPDELSTLQKYYMFAVSDADMPNDVFAYRAALLRQDPFLEDRARTIYVRVITKAGIVE